MTFAFSKWPLMTLTLNDTIEHLKVILKGYDFDCIALIINLIVADWTVLVPSFNTIKTHGISFALPKLFLLFYENLDKNISRNSLFYPFHPTFYPSYFCLLRGWKVPSEPLFLASIGVFLLLSLQKNNPAFLAIFAWIMWFSIDDGIWLFRG